MHLNKPSEELVIDLINTSGPQTPLKVGSVTFDAPVVTTGARNTSIVVRGIRAQGFRGQRTMRYNRLDLAVAMPPTEGQSTEVAVPNDGFETKLEVCDRLNKQYNLKIGPNDIVDGPVDTSVLPATTTIQAKATSLAWFGTLQIEFVPDRPFYKDTFSSFVLNGLPMPEAASAGLISPANINNTSPSFTVGGNLYQPGNGTYPATSFLVSRNSEIELAISPRVTPGDVAVAPDSMGYNYALSAGTANSWDVLFSIGSRATPGVAVDSLYAISMLLTGPDGTELVLALNKDGTGYYFGSTDKTIRFSAITNNGEADGALFQSAISVADMANRLGTLTRTANGAPLGTYKVRLQARRKNTIVPRVLASMVVRVTA